MIRTTPPPGPGRDRGTPPGGPPVSSAPFNSNQPNRELVTPAQTNILGAMERTGLSPVQAVLALTAHILLQVRRAGGGEQGSLTLSLLPHPSPSPGHCAPPPFCSFKHTSSPRDRHLLWPMPLMRDGGQQQTHSSEHSLSVLVPGPHGRKLRPDPGLSETAQLPAPAWTPGSPSQDLSTDGISWKHQTLCSPFSPYSPMSTPFSSLAESPIAIPVGLDTGAAWPGLPPPKYYHVCPQPGAPGELTA